MTDPDLKLWRELAEKAKVPGPVIHSVRFRAAITPTEDSVIYLIDRLEKAESRLQTEAEVRRGAEQDFDEVTDHNMAQRERITKLEVALKRLELAADAIDQSYFDIDTDDNDVDELREAILAASALTKDMPNGQG